MTAAKGWSARFDRLRSVWARSVAVLRAPRIRIRMYGDAHAKRIFQAFMVRHRLFKFTRAKRWGVALVRLPETKELYLAGPSKELVRRKRRAAARAGFHYAPVAAAEHLDEILAINLSSPTRQGRSLPAYYLDREHVATTFADRPIVHGVLNAAGQLRAYAWVPRAGDFVLFETLLGHADDLEAGIMYLLISEVIGSTIESRDAAGLPAWAMYDTFWGAAPGLAYFKERLGFEPYTVDWTWLDRP
jgi:hypothetical protein